MICPYCLCQTEPDRRYHESDHLLCRTIQDLRQQLAEAHNKINQLQSAPLPTHFLAQENNIALGNGAEYIVARDYAE